jgi:hypothetical protein
MEDIMSKKKCAKSLSKKLFSVIGKLKIDDKKGDHDGWLICDGRELDREEYVELFAIIGTSFGAGDGKTTFNLPNFKDETTWKNRMAKDDGYITEGAPQVAGYVKGGDFVPACEGIETVLPDLLYLQKKREREMNVFILAKKL